MFWDNHILFASFNITSTRNHLQHIKILTYLKTYTSP